MIYKKAREGEGEGREGKGNRRGGKGRERKGRAEKPSLNPANSRLDSTRSFSLSLNASGLFSEASTLPFPGHRISINTDWNFPASVCWWQDSAGDSQESLVSSSHQASHCSITWLASVANLRGPGINWKPASEEDLGYFLVLTEWEFSPTGLDYSWMESWTVWVEEGKRPVGCTHFSLSRMVDVTGQLLQAPAPSPPKQEGLYPWTAGQNKSLLS